MDGRDSLNLDACGTTMKLTGRHREVPTTPGGAVIGFPRGLIVVSRVYRYGRYVKLKEGTFSSICPSNGEELALLLAHS